MVSQDIAWTLLFSILMNQGDMFWRLRQMVLHTIPLKQQEIEIGFGNLT
jgi:hypothetical protein